MKDESNSLLAQFDDSKRILASLMARENITVQVVDGLQTAMFDTVHRIMRVPAWKGLSKDQVDVLVGHEMGHALFTDNSVFESLAKDNKRGLFTYLNVVEDARIERKMRNSYPGLQRVFYKGYSEFHAGGPIFKGTSTTLEGRDGQQISIASMKLIDRINLHFKIGAFVKVPFTADELPWLRKIERCTSTDEALEIARALHKLSKEPKSDPQSGQDGQPGQDGQDKSKSKEKSKSDKTPQNDEGDESDSGDDSDSQNGNEQDGDTKDSDSDGDGDESKSDKDSDSDGDSDGDESDSDSDGDSDGDESDSDSDSDGDQQDGDNDGDSDSDSDTDGDDAAGDDGDSDSDSDSDSDDSSSQDGASSDGENPITPDSADEGDDDDVATTQQDADEALKNATKPTGAQEIKNVLIAPLSEKVVNERTVTAAQWTDATIKALDASGSNWKPIVDKLETEWKNKFEATAKQMAREFDARKNAKAMQQARSAKTGKLNVEKLASYKFTADLFIRSMTMPRGQSHGIVMVIDGSSSMNDTFASVLDQTLLFAHFAVQVGVPFEAYMFTNAAERDRYQYETKKFTVESAGLQTLGLPEDGQLVGLINTTTDRGAFRRQVRAVLALQAAFRFDWNLANNEPAWYQATQTIPYVRLYYTPLYVGVMLAERHLARMKRQLRLDKVMLMVISDGEDSSGLVYDATELDYDGKLVTTHRNIRESACVVRDTVTKKQFAVGVMSGRSATTTSTSVLSMLFDVVRARHDARVIYMYIVKQTVGRRSSRRRGGYGSNRDNIMSALRYCVRQGCETPASDAVQTAFDADGQYVVPADRNVGDLTLLVANAALDMDDTTFDKVNTSGMSTKKIAAAFTETMTANRSNKVFVNTVVPFII